MIDFTIELSLRKRPNRPELRFLIPKLKKLKNLYPEFKICVFGFIGERLPFMGGRGYLTYDITAEEAKMLQDELDINILITAQAKNPENFTTEVLKYYDEKVLANLDKSKLGAICASEQLANLFRSLGIKEIIASIICYPKTLKDIEKILNWADKAVIPPWWEDEDINKDITFDKRKLIKFGLTYCLKDCISPTCHIHFEGLNEKNNNLPRKNPCRRPDYDKSRPYYPLSYSELLSIEQVYVLGYGGVKYVENWWVDEIYEKIISQN